MMTQLRKISPIFILQSYFASVSFEPRGNVLGVPTSKDNTTQQWDFPNNWSPLQAIVIQGMERSQHPIGKYIAYKMAQRWIKTTYTGFNEHGYMYEKVSKLHTISDERCSNFSNDNWKNSEIRQRNKSSFKFCQLIF